jgi:type II secretory pathway pseudopilin PulG
MQHPQNNSNSKSNSSPRRRSLRAFTIVETAVVAGAIVVAASAAIPVFRKVGCNSMRAQSAAQMAALAVAHAAYAADFDDRQFTLCPDNLGAYNGNWAAWQAANGCAPHAIFGTSAAGVTYHAGPACNGSGGGGEGWLTPMLISSSNASIGAYRITNCRSFNSYVGGRFLDQAFYAPDDPSVNRKVQRKINEGADYEPSAFQYSTYDYSPAAMFHPRVMGDGTSLSSPSYANPNNAATAAGLSYKSPSNSQCLNPALKTRLLERFSMEGFTGANPDFSGGTTPYFWNHSYRSRGLALFFDGSVRLFTPREAMESEYRAASNAALWVRNTPLGSNGYFGAQSADFLVDTSVHYLTASGIRGRDTLAPQ